MNIEKEKQIKYGVFSFLVLVVLICGIKYYGNINDLSEPLKIGKVMGHYSIDNVTGPSPFYVNLTELETGEQLKNVKISEECPEYSTNMIGKKLALFKMTVLNPKTQEHHYEFDGLYEAVCTTNPQEIDDKIDDNTSKN